MGSFIRFLGSPMSNNVFVGHKKGTNRELTLISK